MRIFVGIGLILSVSAARADLIHAKERINQRYDDFFRYIHEREERLERQQKGHDDRKKAEEARAEKLEREREKYVLERKSRPNMEGLRLKYEEKLKEHQEQMELLRRRYVQQRDEIEQYLKKGRMIPAMKEYDLEGY